MPGNPLQQDGVVGHLTSQQQETLKDAWLEFFALVDKAPEVGTAGDRTDASDVKVNDKEPGKDIPKDDDAKDRLRAEAELKDAKAALEKYGRRRFMKTFWDFIAMDDPDVLMLRFCRARKWDVARATAMLAACMKWRIESGVEDIVRKGEEGMSSMPKFIQQLESGKTYTQGTDLAGRPVCYIHVGLHKTNGQPAETMQAFVFQQMEAVRLMLADKAEKVTIIFDMTGFGLSNMDWRVILLLVKCLEAYYPESLNVMIPVALASLDSELRDCSAGA